MARTPPPRKVARDIDAENDGTRTKRCGCRIDIETGDTIEPCEGHDPDADGYDDEQPLYEPDEAGR